MLHCSTRSSKHDNEQQRCQYAKQHCIPKTRYYMQYNKGRRLLYAKNMRTLFISTLGRLNVRYFSFLPYTSSFRCFFLKTFVTLLRLVIVSLEKDEWIASRGSILLYTLVYRLKHFLQGETNLFIDVLCSVLLLML